MSRHFNPRKETVKGHTEVARLWLTLTTALLVPVAALAQSSMPATDQQGMSNSDAKPKAAPMDHSKMPGMDHGSMPGMKPEAMPMDHSKMPGMDPSSMSSMPADRVNSAAMKMDMGAMQGGAPPMDARDPDAYSDGLSMGPMNGMDMADN